MTVPNDRSIAKHVVRTLSAWAIAAGSTLYWDGIRTADCDAECKITKKAPQYEISLEQSQTISAIEARQPVMMAASARPGVKATDIHCVPRCTGYTIDWRRIAAQTTFFLDPRLFRHTHIQTRGELVWIRQNGDATTGLVSVRPAVIIHAGSSTHQGKRIELIPTLPAADPLFQHLVLVLHAVSAAEDASGWLYVETLTNALAEHFFRRYVGKQQIEHDTSPGLSPYKLRQVTEYITAHLEEPLSLTQLAQTVQMSFTYFARQFKQAIGETPHQYVIRRRLERARQLLTETDLPLIDVGSQAGFSDQSHFIAVFHRQVGFTPKAYRESTRCSSA